MGEPGIFGQVGEKLPRRRTIEFSEPEKRKPLGGEGEKRCGTYPQFGGLLGGGVGTSMHELVKVNGQVKKSAGWMGLKPKEWGKNDRVAEIQVKESTRGGQRGGVKGVKRGIGPGRGGCLRKEGAKVGKKEGGHEGV